MNKTAAIKILALEPDACLEDAKSAYRRLAKKHHPDLAGGSPEHKASAEDRMKEVNLAFRTLAPSLKTRKEISAAGKTQEPDPKSAAEPSPSTAESNAAAGSESRADWFGIFKEMARLFTTRRPGRASEKRAPVPPFSSQKKRGSGIRGKRRRGNSSWSSFESVLETVQPGHGGARRVRKNRRLKGLRRENAFRGYQSYMAMKRKIRAGRPLRRGERVERVEKIEPVRPVGRVER